MISDTEIHSTAQKPRAWLPLTEYSQRQYYEDIENFCPIYILQDGLLNSQDVFDPALQAGTNCGGVQVGSTATTMLILSS